MNVTGVKCIFLWITITVFTEAKKGIKLSICRRAFLMYRGFKKPALSVVFYLLPKYRIIILYNLYLLCIKTLKRHGANLSGNTSRSSRCSNFHFILILTGELLKEWESAEAFTLVRASDTLQTLEYVC